MSLCCTLPYSAKMPNVYFPTFPLFAFTCGRTAVFRRKSYGLRLQGPCFSPARAMVFARKSYGFRAQEL